MAAVVLGCMQRLEAIRRIGYCVIISPRRDGGIRNEASLLADYSWGGAGGKLS